MYVIPKSKDLGFIGIAEIILGLFLQGEIIGKNGKPVSEACLARGFEQLFNIQFGSIYDKVDEVCLRRILYSRLNIFLNHFFYME